MTQPQHIRYHDLATLKRWNRNYRQGDVGAIIQSIARFGFNGALRVWRDNVVIAGNHALAALLQMKASAYQTPRGIVEHDGKWLIPCVDVSHLSEIEAEAYAIADNRTQERGDNDAEQLAALLVEIAAEDRRLLLATGYDGDDVDALLAEAGNAALGADDPGAQIDRAEELQAKWQVQRGDVWQIGAHRLMCGDSTNAEDVARLMADANCQTLIFDPPWDAGIKTSLFSAASILVFTDGARAFDTVSAFGAPSWVFTWDCISSWYTPNRPLRRAKYCFWYGDIEQYIFDGAHYGDAGDVREVQNTRGSYTFQPDPRGKHLSDIFSLAITAFHSEGMHSHEKPIDWMRLLIGNCGGGDVYDPFTGSGTTLVACEQLGRRGYGMEIEPKYCAVTLERLVGMGLTPELVNGVHTKKDE